MDAHVRWVDGEWTLGRRWVDAQPTFKDAVRIWSRDDHGHASE